MEEPFQLELPLNTTTGSAIVVFTILLFSYYFLIKKRLGKPNGRKPPQVDGAWPLLGHLPLFRGSQLPCITLGSLVNKYGPIFTIKMGVHQTIVINNWELAKECFTEKDIAISSRPKLVAAQILGYDYAIFGLAPYGQYWRELRKIATLELLSHRRVELLKDVRTSEIGTTLKELYEMWEKRKDEMGRASVEMREWFGQLTLNVILRIIAGKRLFGCGDSGVGEKEAARNCHMALREFFKLMAVNVVGDLIPWLGWIDLGGDKKKMKRTAKELDSIMSQWLDEHKQKRACGEPSEGEKDFMDVMMTVLDGSTLGGFNADTITKATCLSMILGGNDTTAVTLTWALALLLNNRHTLKKLQDELDCHVGNGRLVNESDISNLAYLQAVVKETLRLYPLASILYREFTQDCTVGGYHAARGSRLMVNLRMLHTDPRIWAEPFEFKPERFMTTHKDVDVKGQNFELLPFGGGRRACAGLSLGIQMIELTLASLIHAFKICPLIEPVDMTGSIGATNMKAQPFDVLIKPRLSSHLYGV